MTPGVCVIGKRRDSGASGRWPRLGRAAAVGLVATVVLGLPAVVSAAWREPVGGARPISDIGGASAIASIGGIPYVAWAESHGPASEIFVARLSADGTAWVKVGGPVNADTSHSAYDPTLTSVGGVPYVAWVEQEGGNYDLRVARPNAAGTAWVEPWRGEDATHGGVDQTSTPYAQVPMLASVDGVPYVVWDAESTDPSVPYGIRVARLDPTTSPSATWVQPWTGESATHGGIADYGFLPTIAAIDGVPYIAWLQNTPSGGSLPPSHVQVRVARLNPGNGTWEQPWTGVSDFYGGINQSPSDDAAEPFNPRILDSRPSLASINAFPYVGWVESTGAGTGVRVARLDTSTFPAPTWTQVAAGVSATDGRINASPTAYAGHVSLTAVDAAPFGVEVPYVGWDEYLGTGQSTIGVVRVARFNAATHSWEEPWPGVSQTSGAINLDPAKSAIVPGLTSVNGVPYLVRNDAGIRVSRLEPEFSAASVTPSARGATFTVHAHTYGIGYPVGFQYGNALQSDTPTQAATLGNDNVTVTQQVSGLTPTTSYQFRPFATAGTPFPPVSGTAMPFTTTAASTTTPTTNSKSPTRATITTLSETNLVFAAGGSSTALSGQTAAARHKRGTVFSFRLDQPATVTIAIRTKIAGRRVGRACRPANRSLRHKPACTRTVTVATLTRTAHAGLNRVAFTGRIRGRALTPGGYEAVFTATNAAGASRPGSLGFTLVKR